MREEWQVWLSPSLWLSDKVGITHTTQVRIENETGMGNPKTPDICIEQPIHAIHDICTMMYLSMPTIVFYKSIHSKQLGEGTTLNPYCFDILWSNAIGSQIRTWYMVWLV